MSESREAGAAAGAASAGSPADRSAGGGATDAAGMSARSQWTIVAAVVLLLAGVLVGATRLLGGRLAPVSVGARAPEFHAVRLADGTHRSLADYRGQVVLLNIWATWCLPCRVEMPSMQQLHQEFAPRGLKIVAVSIDPEGKEQEVREFVAERGLTFEVLHDAHNAIQRTYQSVGVPETFVIGRDGVIRRRQTGAHNWSSPNNRALIAQLLAEEP